MSYTVLCDAASLWEPGIKSYQRAIELARQLGDRYGSAYVERDGRTCWTYEAAESEADCGEEDCVECAGRRTS